MVIGVPSGTMSHNCLISAFDSAMHPSVQSRAIAGPRHALGWPWMKMSPPGERPRASA
jgi:hypothetical protein